MAFFDILIGGVFHAAVLFLVAAGWPLVFGVHKIVKLACGSFYALRAYFGITTVNWAIAADLPPWTFLPVLIASGIVLGAIGPFIERLLRTVYNRDESFQLLLTFALVLIFQDVLRFFWGANPRQLGNLSMLYGKVALGDVSVPTYNVAVIVASVLIVRLMRAAAITFFAELEVLAIYLVVILVLIARPSGLFGKAVE